MQIKGTYKEILNIALPVIIGSFAQSINQLIDTVFLSRLGERELGGATLSGMLYFLFCMIFFGFTRGGQILIARASGQKNDSLISSVFGQMWVMAFFLLLITSVFLFFGQHFLLDTFIENESLKPFAYDFLNYRILGLPMVLCAANFQGFFTGMGTTRIITVATIIMALSNIILDWALIFGHLGLPQMGVKGAALATSIAEMIWAIIYLIYFLYKKYHLTINFSFKKIKIETTLLFKLINLSMPLVVQNLFGLGSWFFFFQAIEKTGERNLAISSILKGLYVFILVPGWGFATTANTVISNIFGQDRKEDILAVIKKLMIVSGIAGSLICVCIGLFPEFVLGLFTKNKEIIQQSYQPLMVVLFSLIIFSISCVQFQSISALGATKISMYYELISVVFYVIFLCLVIYIYNLPLYIAWMGEIIYWLVLFFISSMYLLKGKWKLLPSNINDNE
jgi:MATE family multidrug resistance protein